MSQKLIKTQNTANKPGLRLAYSEEVCQIAGLLFKIPYKMLSFVPTSLILHNVKSPINNKISKLQTTFEAEIILLEIKFYKGAKRLGGEQESGRNDSGANGKVGETTRGRNDSGRKGKWAKRLRDERESGRNDPDSLNMASKFKSMKSCKLSFYRVSSL